MATSRADRAHTPAYLQNVSLGFRNRAMIADRVSPRIPVKNKSDNYRIWGRNALMSHESRWAPGTIPNAIEMRWSTGTYNAEIRKLRTMVLDTERRNSDSDLRLDTRATEIVTDAMIISREVRIAAQFANPANYSAGNKITKSGGAEWDQAAVFVTDQPVQDLMAIARAVSLASMVPLSELSIIIPEIVYTTAIYKNTAILDRIKYSERGIVTYDLLAALIGVKEVIPAAAAYVGAGPEVAGSDVITGYVPQVIWGDTVWVGLINDGSNDMVPTFARTFNWQAETGGQERQIRVYRAEDEGREGEWHECKEAMDEKIIFADAGGVILNTLSTI